MFACVEGLIDRGFYSERRLLGGGRRREELARGLFGESYLSCVFLSCLQSVMGGSSSGGGAFERTARGLA